jgi:hypothetical protein
MVVRAMIWPPIAPWAATAGASVVVKGLVDRTAGEADLCQSTLEEATRAPTPPKGQ